MGGRHGIDELVAVVYEVEPGRRGVVETGLRGFLLRQGENLPIDSQGKRSLHSQHGQQDPVLVPNNPPAHRTEFPAYIWGRHVEGNVPITFVDGNMGFSHKDPKVLGFVSTYQHYSASRATK